MSYSTSSRRYLTPTQKPIIHSRESSIDSRTSSSTTDSRYTSSRTSMANGYQGSSQSKDHSSERIHRVSDSDGYRITTKSSRNVDVTNHKAYRTVPEEPRASEATYKDYKESRKYYSGKRHT